MSRYISLLFVQSSASITMRIRFLPNVCQLVRWTASPKHPHSLMASVSASQSVNGVNTSSSRVLTTRVRCRAWPNRMFTPQINSTMHNSHAMPIDRSVSMPNPKYCRYSVTLIEVPAGSTHLARPLKMNTAANRN